MGYGLRQQTTAFACPRDDVGWNRTSLEGSTVRDASRASLSRSIAALCFAAALGLQSSAGQTSPPDPSALVQVDAEVASSKTPIRAARLTFSTGAVEIGRTDNTAVGEPVTNLPLVEGTRIATGDYGQAEIEFEDGSVARLTPRTVLTLNKLTVEHGVAHTELELLAGLAYFELRQSSLTAYSVDAAGTRLTPLENLTVRIGLDNPPAAFAVLSGSAKVERPGEFTAELHAGESLRGIPDGGKPYFRTNLIVPEPWDSWNLQRDQTAAGEADQRTVARDPFAGNQGYGWSDLDSHGNWYTVPGAGPVWQPENADEGFDPYGFGNWVYVNNSYAFASGYSWGWTPFHCGAWQYFGGFGWGWSPNNLCGTWGFGGGLGGIFLVGRHPGRFPPVVQPKPGPVHPRPLIPVLGPDGPRPPFARGTTAQIAGRLLSPLPVVEPRSSRAENPIGYALLRDFPVNTSNRQPILGLTSSEAVHGAYPGYGVVPTRTPIGGGRSPVLSRGSPSIPPRGSVPGAFAPALPPRTIAPAAPPAPIRSAPAPSRPSPPSSPPPAVRPK